MNDFMTTFLLIGTETSILLFLVMGVFIVINYRKKAQDKKSAMILVNSLKESEAERKSNLELVMQNVYGYKEDELEENVNAIIETENKLYSKIIQLYLGSDRDSIKTIDSDVKKIVEAYRGLVEDTGDEDNGEKASSLVVVRNENEALRLAKAQLEADLAASIEAMENMMKEYANMYEGGQKEGDQRVKNEMFKLRQKLENKVSPEDLDDDIPDLSDEIDLDSEIK